jgi:UDP-2-acetamido-3-amino-2,3-dideoxy-glucuronate N-acetyltransferase
MSRHAHRLNLADSNGVMSCPETGYRYKEVRPGILQCLDLDEEAALSDEFSIGVKSYRRLKEETYYEYSTARP